MTRVQVLGPVRLEDAEPPPPRVRRLLAVLAADAGHVVSTDRLAAAVWGEDPPRNVEGSLHTVVSRLRSALRSAGDAPQVLTQEPGYVLRIGADDLDAARFEALVAAAGEETEPPTAERVLTEALALWRGPAFDPYTEEEFARPEAARLEELRLAAAEHCVEARLTTGNNRDAASLARWLTAVAPLRERPRSQLMLVLAREGRQAESLAVYRSYRDLLDAELGLEPSPELQELHTAVLRHQPDVLRRPSPPRTDGPAVAARPQSLVGRDDDVAEIVAALVPGSLLTLTGPGGVGKTSLALAVADAVGEHVDDGVRVSFLSSLPDPESLPLAVTTALGVPPRHGVGTMRRLVDFLRPRSLLLVLDGCEHVRDVAAALAGAIHRLCPGVAVLTTSRTPLSVAGEQVRPLRTLEVPRHGASAAEVAATEAGRLFLARAREAAAGFTLDERNAAAVSRLCHDLDGLPLAIELAATRMRVMGPDDLVERLAASLDLLEGPGAGTGARHATLRSVLDWSYDLLTPDLQRVHQVLSVFAARFTLAEAEGLLRAVAGTDPTAVPGRDAVTSAVLALVDHSLVTRAGAGEYVLLSTVRTYGRDRLRNGPHHHAVRRAHAALFADLAAATTEDLFGRRQVAAVARLESRTAELRAAHAWALEHDLALAARLVGSLAVYVEHRMPAEVTLWADATVRACESGALEVPGLAGAYAVAASGARFLAALGRARTLAERGLELVGREAVPDPATEAYLRFLLAEVALFEGRDADAAEQTSRAIAAAGGQERLPIHDMLEGMEALLLAYRGDPGEAARRAGDLRSRALRDGEDVIASWATYMVGEALMGVEPDEATAHLRDALARSAGTGDAYLAGVTLVSLASLRARRGDPLGAVGDFADVVEHWHRAGNWVHQWTTLRNVMDLLLRLDRHEEAAVLHGALNSRSTSSAPFGEDARRMRAAEEELTGRLGGVLTARLRSSGARMSDEEVVAAVLTGLRDPAPALSRAPQPRDDGRP